MTIIGLHHCQDNISLLACDIGQQYAYGTCSGNNLTLSNGITQFTSPSIDVIGNVIFHKNGTVIFRRPKSLTEFDLRNNPMMTSTGYMVMNGTILIEIAGTASLGKIPLLKYTKAIGTFNL